jgi:hypothetical protein
MSRDECDNNDGTASTCQFCESSGLCLSDGEGCGELVATVAALRGRRGSSVGGAPHPVARKAGNRRRPWGPILAEMECGLEARPSLQGERCNFDQQLFLGVTARALSRFVRRRLSESSMSLRHAGGAMSTTDVVAATAAVLRSTAEYVWAEARNERSGSPWTFQSQWLQDRSGSDPRRGNVGPVETGQFEVIAQTRALMVFNADADISLSRV